MTWEPLGIKFEVLWKKEFPENDCFQIILKIQILVYTELKQKTFQQCSQRLFYMSMNAVVDCIIYL